MRSTDNRNSSSKVNKGLLIPHSKELPVKVNGLVGKVEKSIDPRDDRISLDLQLLELSTPSAVDVRDGFTWDVGGFDIGRASDSTAILLSSHCIKSSQLLQSKERMESSAKAVLIGGAYMSSVGSRDAAVESNSALEFGEEVSVDDSAKEGRSRSNPEDHNTASCN